MKNWSVSVNKTLFQIKFIVSLKEQEIVKQMNYQICHQSNLKTIWRIIFLYITGDINILPHLPKKYFRFMM